MSNILFVLSGANHWTQSDGSSMPAGFFAEELVRPHQAFTESGHAITIASPGGRRPTMDQASIDPQVVGPDAASYRCYVESIAAQLESPAPLSDVSGHDYDAIVIPGGHAPMEDLHADEDLGRILSEATHAGAVVAAVCHGPAALLSATRPDGTWLFAGRRVVSLTNEEEEIFGTAAGAPWLLESRLRASGGVFEGAAPWTPHVVRDRRLITGQNPHSSALVADAILEELSRTGPSAAPLRAQS